MPLPILGATIAALVESPPLTDADRAPHEPPTAMALISTLGVLTRDHDGELPTVRVPESLLTRAARLIENTADLVHQGSSLPRDVAEDVRPHLQKALSEDAARLRALMPGTDRRPGSVLWRFPTIHDETPLPRWRGNRLPLIGSTLVLSVSGVAVDHATESQLAMN
ncbi:hypothetical protein ACFTWF_41780 [Rhodococcus sp. NPDC056960]|uniref:hypothetical protein n=1 Tax=Rhodococcus sp. NPDC056960 TaxID=3345982 RepID=UPI0036411A31